MKRYTLVSLGVLAAGGGTAVAVAATRTDDRQQTEQAIISDAAQRLSVSPDKLREALGAAEDAQLDQAVKDGKLTQQQADAMKQRRRQNGSVLGMGPGRHGGRGPFGGPSGALDRGTIAVAAAKALGLSADALRTQLRAGKSLADLAKAQNKDLADVKAAIKRALSNELDAAVKDQRITAAQRDRFLAHLDELIAHVGERSRHGGPGGPPAGGPGWGFRHR